MTLIDFVLYRVVCLTVSALRNISQQTVSSYMSCLNRDKQWIKVCWNYLFTSLLFLRELVCLMRKMKNLSKKGYFFTPKCKKKKVSVFVLYVYFECTELL